jgi:hypothetical protein
MMKLYTYTILGLALLLGLGASSGLAQSTGSSSANPTAKPAAAGTYQLIRMGKVEEVIQSEVLVLIESQRHLTEIAYYRLSDNLLVKILPVAEITKPDFVPLTALYQDENSEKGATK